MREGKELARGILAGAVLFLGSGCVSLAPYGTSPDPTRIVGPQDSYAPCQYETELERVKRKTGTQRYKDWYQE